MTDLNLQIIFNSETQFMNISNTSSLGFLCSMIRQIFKKTNPSIDRKKLIIFNGIPPKKIYEHSADLKSTLADLKIYNNSILRFDVDEDNFFSESYMDNSDNILAQQKELDKYAKSGEKGDSSVVRGESGENKSKSSISGSVKEEKKEEGTKEYGKNRLVRKIIPADNSCLFTSINYSFYGVMGDPMIMRELIAARIMSDTNLFNEAILDKKPEDYCNWIMDKNSWGGGIELSIIPSILSVRIGVVSIRDAKIDYFGEDYDNVIFVLYNGIHYDSIVRQTDKGDNGVFSALDKSVEEDLIEMAKDLKTKNEFVDMKKYKLKCDVCYKPLEGNKEAVEHSKSTGHINFVQFS